MEKNSDIEKINITCLIYKLDGKWISALSGSEFNTVSSTYTVSQEIFEDSLYHYLIHYNINDLFDNVKKSTNDLQNNLFYEYDKNQITIFSTAKINTGVLVVEIQYKLFEK